MARNKKPTELEKQQIAEHRKAYLIRFRRFMSEIGLQHMYSLMSTKLLEKMYCVRTRSATLYAAEKNIANNVIKDGQSFVRKSMQNIRIPLIDFNYEISLADYYELWLTVISFTNLENENFDSNLPQLKAFFYQYYTITDEKCHYFRMYNASFQALHPTLLTYGFVFSSFNFSYVWAKQELICKDGLSPHLQLDIAVYIKECEQQKITINNNTRTAYRIGWGIANNGFKWIQLTPSTWQEKNSFANIPLDVYIQAHAIERLKERLDGIMDSIIFSNVYASLNEPKIKKLSDERLLIEYRLNEYKAGYLVAKIVDGVVLIRTFLLLSNSSTPEGEKLIKLTGLSKLDMSYLAIDKLSAFCAKDIKENKKVMDIIQQAGCESLLELSPFVFEMPKTGLQETGKMMEAYLQLISEPQGSFEVKNNDKPTYGT